MAESNINKKKYMVFDLVKILREHTDRLHPMKQKELVDRLHEAGYSTDRSTVRRTITDLVLDPESRIRSVSNTAHDEKDSDYETYYSGLYYDQEFSDAELRWLIDGILYSRNVPHEARKDLLEKLCNLGNAHFRRNLNLNKIRRLAADEPVNPELFENIDRVGRAIDSGRKISVVYNNMGTDFTLHPRWNSAHLLNPYAMVIRNGFYYLICNNDHHTTLTVYRMDRMTDVQIEEKLPVRPVRELDGFHEGWNLQEFMEHNANMAFGDPERITFDCAEKGVPFHTDAVFCADIREIDRTRAHHGQQKIRLPGQKPHGARFTVQDTDEHFQRAGKGIRHILCFKQLLQEIKQDADEPFALHESFLQNPRIDAYHKPIIIIHQYAAVCHFFLLAGFVENHLPISGLCLIII